MIERSQRFRVVPKGAKTTQIRVSEDFSVWLSGQAGRLNISIPEYTRQWIAAIQKYGVRIPGAAVDVRPVKYRRSVPGE